MRRTLRKANIDMALAMLSICRDWNTGGDLRAKKEGTFEPSYDEGCFRRRGGGDKPPAHMSRAASEVANPRNLRRGRLKEPPTRKCRRIDCWAEDTSVRQSVAPDKERVESLWCEIT